MGWNYRVIQKKHGLYPGEFYYEIHEVYYNKDDSIWGMTTEPSGPFGDSIEEIRSDLELMIKALDKPVLVEEEIVYVPHQE